MECTEILLPCGSPIDSFVMRKIFVPFLLLLLSSSCIPTKQGLTRQEGKAVDFLYEYMDLADKGDYSEDFFLANVRVSYQAGKEMGWRVPKDIFRHFVLPVRVGTERLDSFRIVYYDSLKARVAGMSMREAALEVNHWCHERVTYAPTDSRTSSPLATIRNAEGRCGEESVLTVAAMRAVGIPARQVYTPRWAHTDDNHAWVEVWVDGEWHFLGACEPEADLDMAWFNEPAARAMLMHTLVYGDYRGSEDVIKKTATYTEINVISNYVPMRQNVVTVLDTDGNPVPGAEVSFCIYNYGEFYPAVTLTSDSKGQATLHSGMGDMLVWVVSDGIFGTGLLTTEGEPHELCELEVVLDRGDEDIFSVNVDITPPPPGLIAGGASDEAVARNAVRLALEDSLRVAYTATFPSFEDALELLSVPDSLSERAARQLADSRGNWRTVKAFVERHGYPAVCLIEVLSRKDVRDTPLDVLEDAIEGYVGSFSDEEAEYVLNPRIANEFIRPYRKEIKAAIGRDPGAEGIICWCSSNISLEDKLNPRGLQTTPAGTLKMRAADAVSRDIFLVAALRTYGYRARVDVLTGKAQYKPDGAEEWIDVWGTGTEAAPEKGWLSLYSVPGEGILDNPEYYRHFTLSRLQGGQRRLLEFEGGDATELGAGVTAKDFSRHFALDEGVYLLTSGNRMASGAVLARMVTFVVKPGQTTTVQLILREDEGEAKVIGAMDPEAHYLSPAGETSILSTTGRGYFLVAVLGKGDEPTSHALRDLASLKGELSEWGRPILFLRPQAAKDVKEVSEALFNLPSDFLEGEWRDQISFGVDTDSSIRKMLCEGTHTKFRRLPVIALCDSFGHVLYLSAGYNTSLADRLLPLLDVD